MVTLKSRSERIKQLRESGYGLREISSLLNCPKSTVKYHADKVNVSDRSHILERIKKNAKNGCLAGKLKWERRRESAADEARKEWHSVRQNPQMMAFLGLYWGEGGKTQRTIKIANNDPWVIVAALKTLKRLSSNKHIVATIRCYPDHNKATCANFWRKILPPGVVIWVRDVNDARIGKKQHRSQYGLCYVSLSDWKAFAKIMTWIDCWKQDLKAGVV